MKIMIIGMGGREHALTWKLAQSRHVTELYCAPGNAGIAEKAICVPIDVMDKEGIFNFAKANDIDMVVVAPENPLSAGLVDFLEAGGIRALGPCMAAAQIEASKMFSKRLMEKYGIPTAGHRVFSKSAEAIEYLNRPEQTFPAVIKADGLSLGKGVIIAPDLKSAEAAVVSMIDGGRFGSSGANVIIEDFLTGPEVTVLAFTDGTSIVPMVSSQDHKRAYDNDRGLNTGGMGAFSPSRAYTAELADICMDTIFRPTIAALNAEGIKYKGIIYFGLMLTPCGPRVIEYNSRFGDPEAQCVLPRLKSDLYEIFDAIIDERLSDVKVEWTDEAACCVVMASGGYPEAYDKGFEITGIKEAEAGGAIVFHAGTARNDAGRLINNGGRVLGVTAMGATLDDAIKSAYEGVSKINWHDVHFRRDIGIIKA